MSRIGRLPINVPAGVTVTNQNNLITVKGPLGELQQKINKGITVNIEGSVINVKRDNDSSQLKALHGLYRNLINNMVNGVVKAFEKNLIINGVGYKASKDGNTLILNIGYSHPKKVVEPEGIKIDLVSQTEIVVKGISKEAVGQCAANIRSLRVPDPYHLYGIRYKDEEIVRKEGKKSGK